MPTDVLRTPDARFADLPGWSYVPRYLADLPGYEGLRLHYVDEGPRDAGVTFLCLHGEPSWAYLYRKMLPVFTAAGHRVVAPDWFGFGRSDKPVEDAVYTFRFHRDTLRRLIERLDLNEVCLVVQDWGGLLGLTVVEEFSSRIRRLMILNTAIAVGVPAGEGFEQWRAYAAAHPDLDVAALMKRATAVLSDEEAAAYAAPFPDARYKAGVRRFPQIVPTAPEMEGVAEGRAAVEFFRRRWDGESFMAIGMQDPVLGPHVMQRLREVIRGCPEPVEVADGGHFLQEWGEPLARRALVSFGLEQA